MGLHTTKLHYTFCDTCKAHALKVSPMDSTHLPSRLLAKAILTGAVTLTTVVPPPATSSTLLVALSVGSLSYSLLLPYPLPKLSTWRLLLQRRKLSHSVLSFPHSLVSINLCSCMVIIRVLSRLAVIQQLIRLLSTLISSITLCVRRSRTRTFSSIISLPTLWLLMH